MKNENSFSEFVSRRPIGALISGSMRNACVGGLVALGVVAAACASDDSPGLGVTPDAGSDANNGATGGSFNTGGSGGTGATGGSGGSGASGGTFGSGGSAGVGGSAGMAGMAGAADDAGTDGPDLDANGPCMPGAIQETACGNCGTQSRLCDTDGTWLGWGACGGEVGVCTPGDSKQEPCGSKCGVATSNCSQSCTWLPGPCKNEGVCAPGELTVTTASCNMGEVRTAACSQTCTAGSYSACGPDHTWTSVGSLGAPPGRRSASSTWTGQYVIIAGGYGSSSYLADTYLYNPVTDQWAKLAAWPTGMSGREEPALVFTGTDVIVWGGYSSGAKDDGAVYSFSTNQFTSMSKTNGPSARSDFAYAWDNTGKRMIVWGGSSSSSYRSDGFKYDPASDSWSAVAAAPIVGRDEALFAWDGARRRLYVWGGYGSGYRNDGAYYDAAADSWTTLPAVPAGLTGRERGAAAVVQGKFVVWGGYGSSPYYLGDGAVYDPTSNSWSMLPAAPIAGRYEHVGISDGSRVLFWGGHASSTSFDDGAIYNPSSNSWQGVTKGALVNAPSARYSATGQWTSRGPMVWSGYGSTYQGNGAIYQAP